MSRTQTSVGADRMPADDDHAVITQPRSLYRRRLRNVHSQVARALRSGADFDSAVSLCPTVVSDHRSEHRPGRPRDSRPLAFLERPQDVTPGLCTGAEGPATHDRKDHAPDAIGLDTEHRRSRPRTLHRLTDRPGSLRLKLQLDRRAAAGRRLNPDVKPAREQLTDHRLSAEGPPRGGRGELYAVSFYGAGSARVHAAMSRASAMT